MTAKGVIEQLPVQIQGHDLKISVYLLYQWQEDI